MTNPATIAAPRKPYNDTAGYVASRKCHRPHGGWIVVIDRKNGGDWIDASTRWVVTCFGASEPANGRLLDMPTKAAALAEMKYAAQADSVCGWLEE